MSTEPLLPSYSSATQRPQRPRSRGSNSMSHNVVVSPTTVPVIQTLSALIFTCTTIVSTIWASQSYTYPDSAPPASALLLPYFASLCLTISFGCWVGYLLFIIYDVVGDSETRSKIIIGFSIVGKVVLAGAHLGFWLGYKYSFQGSAHPNWLLMFMAAQAWWDFLLYVVYSWLRDLEGSGN
ncbi:hypothetical protein BBP40_002172 [Aspergillus hancockii]|nr:hypothetical protein BBP40_002172 [Aspergillus hancockii]